MNFEDVFALDMRTYSDIYLWDVLVDVMQASFAQLEDVPRNKFFREMQDADNTHILLMTNSDLEGIGTVSYTPYTGNERCANMFNFCVSPEYRDMGFGRKLGELGDNFTRSLGFRTVCLETEPQTAPFYQKLGYDPLSTLTPLRCGELIVMGKEL